ncbi:hypothetical protein F511_24222 [Dorcoceras hygrometricum]|uniref:Uncharacterized protein n=1 Tax=Dorcoceras hygrometricum TaxID=472368 RepID=A0A2Z7AYT0_9LAMI|nr:hypothetical protein F511_24222 [Dorcoceras hygrometricum]
MIQDFITQMKLSDDSYREEQEEDHDSVNNHEYDEDEDEDEDEEVEEDYDEEEFSFMFEGANTASMEAEDMKQVFPLFNRDLFFSGEGLKPLSETQPAELPVKKVFVEADGRSDDGGHIVTSATPGSDEIAGPFCEWTGKSPEAASAGCKKSNSTGFSKFWRFKDFVGRSTSDGKDTFVFLNKSHAPPRKVAKSRSREVGPPSPKAEITKVRRNGRGGTAAPVSAHAVYLKNKAKQEDRRRTYLPYRPELMGFFTSGNVGLTRNVHPY